MVYRCQGRASGKIDDPTASVAADGVYGALGVYEAARAQGEGQAVAQALRLQQAQHG